MTDSVTINTPELHRKIFVELHALQRQGVACDVILAAVDGEIMAHKIILMAASTYFRRKLTTTLLVEKHPKLFIQGVSITELASIVKYIYSGKLLVGTDSIDATLQVCETLELDCVIEEYKHTLAQKPREINAVYASRNVDAVESISSISSDEEQELYNRTTCKQTAGLNEYEVIDLSTEDDSSATEIQMTSKDHPSTNREDKTANSISSSNVLGAFKDAVDKYPSGTLTESVKQTLEDKVNEATEPNKDSKGAVDTIFSSSGDTVTILYSNTVQPKEKQVLFGDSHLSGRGTTNVTRGRIMSIPKSLKKVKNSAMSGHGSHHALKTSPKAQKTISVPDEAGSLQNDKECTPKSDRRTFKPVSVIRRDNLRSPVAMHVSSSQCDRVAAEDSATGSNETCISSSTNAVVPLNIYKNVACVEGAPLRDKQPEILQNLRSCINKPVIENRFIIMGHKVAQSEDEQLRFPTQLTKRAIESDTKHTDKFDGGTISHTSMTNQTELVFKASTDNRFLEPTHENTNIERSSRYERQTENESMTVYVDDSCTTTETCEKTEEDNGITVKPSWFAHERPRAFTVIPNYDRDLKESSPSTEFSEKRVEKYGEKNLHESCGPKKKKGIAFKSDHNSDFRSTLNVPDENKRKVGTQCKPVVRLRKLTEREIMSWSMKKTEVRQLVKKVSFPRVRLIERKNRNEPPEKKRRKSDIVMNMSGHEVADSMFCRHYLGKIYVKKCTLCNMTFGTVHELHQHFAEDIHQINQQLKEASEEMTCSVCEARFQMAQLLTDQSSEHDSSADFKWFCGSLRNRAPLHQKRPEPALRKKTKSGGKRVQNYSYKSRIPDDVLTQNIFQCDVCHFKATKGYEYHFHMKRVHGKNPVYRCSVKGCSFSTYLMAKLTIHEKRKHFRIKEHKPGVRGPHKTDQNIKTAKRRNTDLCYVNNNSCGMNKISGNRDASEYISTSDIENYNDKRQRNVERIAVSGRKAGRPSKNRSKPETSGCILRSFKDRKKETDVSVSDSQASVSDSQTSVTAIEQNGGMDKETYRDKAVRCERGEKDVKCIDIEAQDERKDSEGLRWRQPQTVPSNEQLRGCIGHRNLVPGDYIVPDLRVLRMK